MERNSRATGGAEGNDPKQSATPAADKRNKQKEDNEIEVKPVETFYQKKENFKTYVWNPEKRKLLGRTSRSWFLILLFYTIFYIFLAGMFALCLYILLLTISPYTPTYRDRLDNPGVTILPNLEGSEIFFNRSEKSTWSEYVKNMHRFLESYNDSVQADKNIQCSPGSYFTQQKNESEEREACQFNRTLLRNCSGTEDPNFGYSQGKPCILLKMNRLIDYQPGKGVPPYVDCEIMKGMGANVVIHFYPKGGIFDLMYFPYYGKQRHVNYTVPLVAMQFENLDKNTPITVQCKLNGPDIVNDIYKDRFSGRIFFTFLLQA
ncbi:protein ATP1B4 [Callorhinchus milii]|uniref:protein ATP1B4 n=1 Tax=Callorhinchus milii TaxID=7868 RepID=UPI001C3FEA38|nr:protein ATP1B4 [Callorhinchus milii]